MLKALISGVADFAHQQADMGEQERLRRTCAYVDAAAAGALIVVAWVVFSGV